MDLLKALLSQIKFFIPLLLGLIVIYFIVAMTFSLFGIHPLQAIKNTNYNILPSPRNVVIKPARIVGANPLNENPYTVAPVNDSRASGVSRTDTQSEFYSRAYENYPNEFYLYLPHDAYVRNVYVVGGNKMQSGVTIKGEAKKEFFNRSRFIISLEDRGELVSTTIAYAKRDPKTSDWIPFTANMGYIPPTVNKCVLVFQNENYGGNLVNDKIVRVPVSCR